MWLSNPFALQAQVYKSLKHRRTCLERQQEGQYGWSVVSKEKPDIV